jgi:hypothetical protein
MTDWSQEEAGRILGVLRRSSDLVGTKKRNRVMLTAAQNGAQNLLAEVHSRRDEDLPTGAKDFVSSVYLGLLREGENDGVE